jgi:ketosteroid isomerase-like protein
MHRVIIALAISLAVVGKSAVASEETDVMVPVQQFVEGFNKSDAKMAEAACAEEAWIIDDFPPHVWHGAGAASEWFKAYEAYARANSMSEAVVTLDKPKHVDVTGADAYVVVPTTLRFKKKTESVNLTGVMTLVLHKAANGWQITAWSWADN